jgi:electron transport complex protein RnfA
MGDLAWIVISSMLVSNFTLVMFLGLCSFIGVTQQVSTAFRLGIANTFVLVITAMSAWFLNKYVLGPAPFLRTIAFIVVIGSAVQVVEMTVRKHYPVLFRQLGIYLPLITTNCAILGLAIFQSNRGYNLIQGLAFALGAGAGLTIALSLMASIRMRTELSTVPSLMRGMGVVLVIASFLSMAFMGFAGLGAS